MIPKQSSWPFFPLLVELVTSLDTAPAAEKKQAVIKTVERCFRLGLKIASHYGVPGQVSIAMFISAMQKDGGSACLEASTEFASAIRNEAIAEFKASIGYKDQTAAVVLLSKGGVA